MDSSVGQVFFWSGALAPDLPSLQPAKLSRHHVDKRNMLLKLCFPVIGPSRNGRAYPGYYKRRVQHRSTIDELAI